MVMNLIGHILSRPNHLSQLVIDHACVIDSDDQVRLIDRAALLSIGWPDEPRIG